MLLNCIEFNPSVQVRQVIFSYVLENIYKCVIYGCTTDPAIFYSLNDNSIVYDSRVVVNASFHLQTLNPKPQTLNPKPLWCTTDPAIFYSLNDNSIVYDGQLVVNANFQLQTLNPKP